MTPSPLFIVVHLVNGDRPMFPLRASAANRIEEELARVRACIDAGVVLEDIEGRQHLIRPASVVALTCAADD